MSRLYDLKQKVEEIIERKGLDPIKTKGAISLKVGVVLSIIRESTPDDPEKIEKLINAAEEILGEKIS